MCMKDICIHSTCNLAGTNLLIEYEKGRIVCVQVALRL